jgi:CheY-like chemotaxis protein
MLECGLRGSLGISPRQNGAGSTCREFLVRSQCKREQLVAAIAKGIVMTVSLESLPGVREATDLHRPRILVIDDEPRVIDGIKRWLIKYDVEVIEGYHGFQGIWRGITEQPDAIITDIMMPFADGEEVIRCLQHSVNNSAVPIFVLTGVSNPGLERRLRNSGVAGYFSKPADMDEFLSELGKYLPLRPRRAP